MKVSTLFNITQPSSSVITLGNIIDFKVSFTPNSLGEKTGTIIINNDDLDEGTYSIIIKGTEVKCAPITTSSPMGGMYNSTSIHVTLVSDETATIYYSLETTISEKDYIQYTEPIIIDAPTKLKNFSIDASGNKESIKTEKYEFFKTVGSVSIADSLNMNSNARFDVYISGNYAYVLGEDNGYKLNVIDINNTTSPYIVGNINIDDWIFYRVYVTEIYIYAILRSKHLGGWNGVKVFNLQIDY